MFGKHIDGPFSMHALLVNHYKNGAFYPVGGASEIALNIIPVIERFGNTDYGVSSPQWPYGLKKQFISLLTHPQGYQGCQKKHRDPLNLYLEVWCTNMEPKLHNL